MSQVGYSNAGLEQIEYFVRHPLDVQQEQFRLLIDKATTSQWGRDYHYREIQSISQFQERVPINTYESFFPYIERALKGEENVLWPGKVSWFAKSSGTTNDKSKFIPVTEDSLDMCHFKAGQDMLGVYFHNHPESKLFTGKSLSIGGSHQLNELNPASRIGDISAVILETMPRFYDLMRAPSKEVALISNWDEKVRAMVQEIIYDDITGMAGVPTWTLILIHKIIEELGIFTEDIREVWPNLEAYFHGGVNFEPYRNQFQQVIPHNDMNYMEVYNASEGFFGIQDESDKHDMLLMLDYGIFYEFIPMEELGNDHPKAYTLDEVELGKNYALVISTNGGLWRYLIGDTVTFTSKYPFKIKISGRTKHFINAFGEELMVDNAEQAIAYASEQTGAIVDNYTAAPIYLQGNQQGGHEWLIEFLQPPSELHRFTDHLDEKLQAVNTDYKAKRVGNLALGRPKVHALPKGSFYHWMAKRGKLGGQNKVPRLANHRQYVEDILQMISVRAR